MLPAVMSHFTPLASGLGGVLLGVASSLLFLVNGRVLGVSGIVGGVPAADRGDRLWRVVFLAGMFTGGLSLLAAGGGALALASESTVPLAIGAGALVGLGTRMSNGCTSGHGLCGLARLSRRSLVATLVFMACAALTVLVVRHVLHVGGAS